MTLRRPARLQTFDYRGGYRYFATCCTRNRQRVFVEPVIVNALRLRILLTSELYGFAVLAYVFMPDHVHLLVEGRAPTADFKRLMRAIRTRATLEFNRQHDGRLWQDGYYERVLRKDEATSTVIEYILNNPIRAGLVENARDYPFSWSVAQ